MQNATRWPLTSKDGSSLRNALLAPGAAPPTYVSKYLSRASPQWAKSVHRSCRRGLAHQMNQNEQATSRKGHCPSCGPLLAASAQSSTMLRKRGARTASVLMPYTAWPWKAPAACRTLSTWQSPQCSETPHNAMDLCPFVVREGATRRAQNPPNQNQPATTHPQLKGSSKQQGAPPASPCAPWRRARRPKKCCSS